MPSNRRLDNQFRAPLKANPAVGIEHNPWYWNPNRSGVKTAPDSFMERLREVGEELACVWNPILERWGIWMRSDRIHSKVCSGWRLLFIVRGPGGEYLPLDERVFARLYAASVMEHGSARKYFQRVEAELIRDREKSDAKDLQDQIDASMPFFDHQKIKNIGKGSKFSTYHA